jgi:hypothetical protein
MPSKPKAEEIEDFRGAIRNMHGCDSAYVRAEDVHEKVPEGQPLAGKTVWEGTVYEFALKGHPKAKTCYAWPNVHPFCWSNCKCRIDHRSLGVTVPYAA